MKSCVGRYLSQGVPQDSYLGFPIPDTHTQRVQRTGARPPALEQRERRDSRIIRSADPEVTWDGVQSDPPSSGSQVQRHPRHRALHLGVARGALCHLCENINSTNSESLLCSEQGLAWSRCLINVKWIREGRKNWHEEGRSMGRRGKDTGFKPRAFWASPPGPFLVLPSLTNVLKGVCACFVLICFLRRSPKYGVWGFKGKRKGNLTMAIFLFLWYRLYVDSKGMVQMNLQSRSRVTDVENKLSVTNRGKGRGRDKLGDWDWHSAEHKIDNWWEPTVWHRELYSTLCNGLYVNSMLKKSGYMCLCNWFTLLHSRN